MIFCNIIFKFSKNMETILSTTHLASKICEELDLCQIRALYDTYNLDSIPITLLKRTDVRNLEYYKLECAYQVIIFKLCEVKKKRNTVLHIRAHNKIGELYFWYIWPNGKCLTNCSFSRTVYLNLANTDLFRNSILFCILKEVDFLCGCFESAPYTPVDIRNVIGRMNYEYWNFEHLD